MGLLEKLSNNKGTVSSALGKKLAADVLTGDLELLRDAIPLVLHERKSAKAKGVRAGAAKIVECVAERRPDLVAPFLEDLLPALDVEEPQTKWMVFMTLGYCASLSPQAAAKGLPYARKHVRAKADGQLCLLGAIDVYLGRLGAASASDAGKAFALLVESGDNPIRNEEDWILEGIIALFDRLDDASKRVALEFADQYERSPKAATRKRRDRLVRLSGVRRA